MRLVKIGVLVILVVPAAVVLSCGLTTTGSGEAAEGGAFDATSEAASLDGGVDLDTGATTPSSCFALSFNGTNNYVTVEDTGDLDPTGPSTVEAWVKLTKDTTDELHVVSHHDHGPRLGYLLMAFGYARDDAGPARLGGCTRYYGGGFMQQAGFGTMSSITIGKWTHLAATYDGTSVRIHVDGKARDTIAAQTSPANADFSGVLRIGRNALGQSFAWGGLIDEVRISKVARYGSADFVPAGRFEADANTIALWHFDEGAGTTVSDVAGTHPGIITGATWVPTVGCDTR